MEYKGGDHIKTGRPELRVAVWLQALVRGLNLQPTGSTPALSVMQSAAAVHGLWRCMTVGPLPFTMETRPVQNGITVRHFIVSKIMLLACVMFYCFGAF